MAPIFLESIATVSPPLRVGRSFVPVPVRSSGGTADQLEGHLEALGLQVEVITLAPGE